MIIKIAEQFSRYPAGRNQSDGPYSGEHFRKKFLLPAFSSPRSDDEVILVHMDGTRGYGSSFLEEAFGGLVREGLSKDTVKKRIKIVATNNSLESEIFDYIEQAVPAN